MIVSHRYGFIFLRTEKTGSTSLFRTLVGLVAEKDELYPADQLVRLRLLRERGSLEGISFAGGRGATRRLFPRLHGLHRHARAADVRAFVGPELFDRYMIVTSERNPYDRQVSLFHHRRGKRVPADPSSFSRCMISPLYNVLHYNRLRNWDVYAIDGTVCADHVIRFETLQEDFRALLERLGVDPRRYPLPHLRDGHRPGRDYRSYYTDSARQAVASWYRREIAHFGYQF